MERHELGHASLIQEGAREGHRGEKERDTEERDTRGTYIEEEITHDKQKKTQEKGDIGET